VNKRDLLLFVIVMLVAAVSTWVLLLVASETPAASRPLACYMHGGSSTGICR
jgi:hypothetical protein